ncbi:hypothetical protein H704_00796 [Bartonella bacilliformis Peru38]|uniref:DUF1561 family protein n=3 Tax=Bartonella bacilliformis TaxID=774 RepID=UPI0004511075|nr:DUF1561 family protein [Bartonella bacilliformis]EYS95359.1 hypothetical protein X470_00889 [Bartonella bacilliformis Peru-18]KEG20551.1 hypothetical protein H704_00796 [Bartonella bacilliformis Peru38]KEG22933.1 hypothetical protein H703_00782 [Bartonella bacilliformis Ver075]
MKLKPFLFFFSLLMTIHTSSAAPVPQKKPDDPHDKSIHVKVHTGGEYCYAPAFVNGESYVYITYCSSASVKFARYDLFKRVAWNVNNVWLCMTAPSSVTGIGGQSTEDWDYLLLRPCVINDPNQQWIIEGNAFYTADKKFRVKDYKWYAYISKNKNDYYDHTLSMMDSWAKIIATPVNSNIKTFIGWKFVSGSSFSTYYITDYGSRSDVFDLYYNPDNGHIFRYFPSTGVLSCMTSQQSTSDNWNWVGWKFCDDTVSQTKDIGFWDISQLYGREGPLLDHQGNFLRVTQYGISWGSPYTVKPDYLKQDTQNSPKSEFLFAYDFDRWGRYVNGNLGDTLVYCPAPGKKENVVQTSTSKTRSKRSLPPDFTLTDAWIRRLYDIARSSTVAGQEHIAFCGPCMLHTLQMLAELQEDNIGGPRQSGGYFFDTYPDRDPFISFRQRFPELAERLQTTENYVNLPWRVGEDMYTRTSRVTRSAALMLLPQYNWRPSTMARTREEMRRMLLNLWNAPSGTLWYISIITSDRDSSNIIGHAQPILSTNQGLVLIPTNISDFSLEDFRSDIAPITTPTRLMYYLSNRGTLRLLSLVTYQMARTDEVSLNLYISQGNCTGEGENRRGNRQLPRTSLLNQCDSGRCAIQ